MSYLVRHYLCAICFVRAIRFGAGGRDPGTSHPPPGWLDLGMGADLCPEHVGHARAYLAELRAWELQRPRAPWDREMPAEEPS